LVPSVRRNREIPEPNAAFTQLLPASNGVICQTVTESVHMVSGFYDIFKRNENGIPVWVDKAVDLKSAKARILQLSRIAPGQYLVVHSLTGRTITTPTILTSSDPQVPTTNSGETLF
jgi:hypothetical protein